MHPKVDARALSVWLYKVAKSQCLMSRRKSKFAPAQMLSLEELMQIQGGGVEPVLVGDDRTTAAVCHGTTVLAWARVDGVNSL